MPDFYPPVPGRQQRITVSLDHQGRTLTVLLPYRTTNQLEVRALRRQHVRETQAAGETPPS